MTTPTTMGPGDMSLLDRHRTVLVRDMSAKETVDALISAGLLNRHHADEILGKLNSLDQNRELLHIYIRRAPTLRPLIEALRATQQHALVNLLQQGDSAENENSMLPHGLTNYSQTLLARIILYPLPVLIVTIFCISFIFNERASVAVLRSRYLNCVAALGMIISSLLIVGDILRWLRRVQPSDVQQVSAMVIALLGNLLIATFIGHSQIIANTYLLREYDVALNYTNFFEVYMDVFYNAVILIFFPILFAYITVFRPNFKSYEMTTAILVYTLLFIFLQKSIHETLIINEHICQELLEAGKQCARGQETRFVYRLHNLTTDQRTKYESMIGDSTNIYTWTMALILANGALLISFQRPRYNSAKSKPLNAAGISKGWKKNCVYFLLLATIVGFLLALPAQPILYSVYNSYRYHQIDVALLVFGIAKLLLHLASVVLFAIVWKSYELPHMDLPHSIDDEEERPLLIDPDSTSINSDAFSSTVSISHRNPQYTLHSSWTIFDIPILLIMLITGWLSSIVQVANLIVHIYAYYVNYDKFIPMTIPAKVQIFIHDFASFALIVSFYVQYRALRLFLASDDKAMKTLGKNKFLILFAPGALVINVLHFGAIFVPANNANYLPPYPTVSIFNDNLLTFLHLAFTASLLLSMTAALCWTHVILRLHKEGNAYRIVPQEIVEAIAS